MRLATIVKGLVAILVAVIVTLVAVLYSTDFSRYKGEISTLVQALTDRRLTIKGDFKASFGLRPAIAVDRVTFSNAKWGSRRDMVRIKSLRAELELFPLLFGNIRIKQVVLSGADILLETRADGVGNWTLLPATRKPAGLQELPTIPTFDKVLIKNSVLVWRDRRTGAKRTVKIDRLRTSAAAAAAPFQLNLKGSYNGEPVKLTGQIDSLARLTSNKPTTIRLKLDAGGARVRVQGRIKEPMTGTGVKVSLSASGKDIATLSGLFGTALPSIGPYDIAATVVDIKSRWGLKQVKLKVGQSDVSGDVYIDPNTAPVRIVAKMQSRLIRAADFQDRRAPLQRVPSKKKKKQVERLFSADRLSFSGLKDISAKLLLDAKLIRIDDFAFEQASFTVAVRQGRLVLRPARARFEGGDLTLYFNLSSVERRPRFNFKADVKRLDLARLAKRLGYAGLVTGRINANTSLSGSGASIRTIMAGLNGHILTTMKGGRIDNKMFARLSGETLSAILPWSSGDKGIPVKCLVAQYGIKKGKLASNVTLLDTDRLLVRGEGGIDLASEKIDFEVAPKAKEARLMNLLVPIRIDGRLAAPDVYADPAGVAKNALGFATGGILANGLVSEIIGSIVAGLSGSDKANPCLAALATATEATRNAQSKGDDVDSVIESIGEGLKRLFSR